MQASPYSVELERVFVQSLSIRCCQCHIPADQDESLLHVQYMYTCCSNLYMCMMGGELSSSMFRLCIYACIFHVYKLVSTRVVHAYTCIGHVVHMYTSTCIAVEDGVIHIQGILYTVAMYIYAEGIPHVCM